MKTKFSIVTVGLLLLLTSCNNSDLTNSQSTTSNQTTTTTTTTTENEVIKIEDLFKELTKDDGLYLTGLQDDNNNGTQIKRKVNLFFSNDEFYSEIDGLEAIHLFPNEENIACEKILNISNTFNYEPVLDFNDEEIPFSNYQNPFLTYTSDLFNLENNSYVYNVGENDQLKVGERFLGYINYPVYKIELSLNNNSLNDIKLYSKDSNFSSLTTLKLSSSSEVIVPEVTTRPETSESKALKEVFEKFKALNYTASYTDTSSDGTITNGKMIVTSDVATLQYNKDNKDYTIGEIQSDENTITTFSLLEDGKIHGITAGQTGLTMLQVLATDYPIAPEFYTYKDGVYTPEDVALPYLYRNSPVFYLEFTLGDHLAADPNNSYKLKINDDGTYTITYSYDYYDYVNLKQQKGDIKINITNVGTTTSPYTLNDYVPYTLPLSWSEVMDESSYSEFETLMGGDTSILPYPSNIGVKNITATFYYGMGYLNFYNEENYTLEGILSSYELLLENAGWSKGSYDEYYGQTYIYKTSTHEISFVIGISMFGDSIELGSFTCKIASPFHNFLRDNFAISNNATASTTINIVSKNTNNEEISNETINYKRLWQDNYRYEELSKNNTTNKQILYYDEALWSVTAYNFIDGNYVSSDTTLYNIPSLSDLCNGYTDYVSEIKINDDKTYYYEVSEYNTSVGVEYLLSALIGGEFTSSNLTSNVIFNFNEETKSFTINMTAKIEEENGVKEITLNSIVSDVGTTVIDDLSLLPNNN